MSLVQMSVSGGVMVLMVVVVRALALHQLPKRLFPAMWGLVCLRLLVPYSLPSRFSVHNLAVLSSGPVGQVLQPAVVYSGTAPAPAANAESLNLPALVWLAGLLACAAWFATAYVRSRGRFAQSLPVRSPAVDAWLAAHPMKRPIAVRESGQVASPLAYGVLRPVVLLPQGMAEGDTEALLLVLTHEYTHIRRGDAVKKLLLAAVLCVHWFNPLVWVLYILANRDIELACDEGVVRALGLCQKSGYALALLGLAEQRPGSTPFASGFSKYAIEERIVSIMKYKKKTFVGLLASMLLLGVLLCGFATTAYAASPFGAESRLAEPGEWQKIEQAEKDWAAFGFAYNAADESYYYNGELVRFFMDNRAGRGTSRFSGTVVDVQNEGTLHLVTRRDSTGALVAIEEITPEEAARLAFWRP